MRRLEFIVGETLQTGDILQDKYEILRKIGEGGMGVVYEGRHVNLDTRVAIKVLLPFEGDDEDIRSRFKAEAQSSANIKHPNVVEVHDFGVTPDDRPFFAMNFLAGESLASLLDRQGVLTQRQTIEITQQILNGIAAAHKKKIVHRDLKPGNIFLAKDEDNRQVVKILDFGISKIIKDGHALTSVNPPRSTDVSSDPVVESARLKTEIGMVMGTPGYMAPESLTGQGVVDHRVDLFAVGVLVFEMLTGQRPFRGRTHREIMISTGTQPVPLLRDINPEVTPEMEQLCLMALAKDPDYRFHTAEEFIEFLAAAAMGRVPEDVRRATVKVGLPHVLLNMKHPPADPALPQSTQDGTGEELTITTEATGEMELLGTGHDENFDQHSSSVVPMAPMSIAHSADWDSHSQSGIRASVPMAAHIPETMTTPVGLGAPGLPTSAGIQTTNQAPPRKNALVFLRTHTRLLIIAAILGAGAIALASSSIFAPKETRLSPANHMETPAARETYSSAATKSEPTKVSIWTDITPSDALIRWNGKLMVERPLRVPVSDRPSKVEVTKPGYKRKVLVVTPSGEQTIYATLQAESPSPNAVTSESGDTEKNALQTRGIKKTHSRSKRGANHAKKKKRRKTNANKSTRSKKKRRENRRTAKSTS